MPINRDFGRSLSDKLMNGTFAGVRRSIVITENGAYDPVTETGGVVSTHTGLCILTKLTKSDIANESIRDAEFVIKKRCVEVVDDTSGESFQVRNDNCEIKVDKLDPVTDVSLGMQECVIIKVEVDAVDAVYTIYGKYR
jgi:hypothetical protein